MYNNNDNNFSNANPYLSYQKFNKEYNYKDPEPPKSPVQILTGNEEKKGMSPLSSALIGANNNTPINQNTNMQNINNFQQPNNQQINNVNYQNTNINQQFNKNYYPNQNINQKNMQSTQNYANFKNENESYPYINNNNN